MSGAGDERWRGGGRGYDPNRQSGQRHHSGGFRERSMGGGGSSHHDRQGHRHQGQATAQNAGNTWGGPLGGPAQDHHVSVRGFNAAESKDALKS
ncbi:hypothetical protein LOZ53_004476, partial [Ophidiomyces ophidiicola]